MKKVSAPLIILLIIFSACEEDPGTIGILDLTIQLDNTYTSSVFYKNNYLQIYLGNDIIHSDTVSRGIQFINIKKENVEHGNYQVRAALSTSDLIPKYEAAGNIEITSVGLNSFVLSEFTVMNEDLRISRPWYKDTLRFNSPNDLNIYHTHPDIPVEFDIYRDGIHMESFTSDSTVWTPDIFDYMNGYGNDVDYTGFGYTMIITSTIDNSVRSYSPSFYLLPSMYEDGTDPGPYWDYSDICFTFDGEKIIAGGADGWYSIKKYFVKHQIPTPHKSDFAFCTDVEIPDTTGWGSAPEEPYGRVGIGFVDSDGLLFVLCVEPDGTYKFTTTYDFISWIELIPASHSEYIKIRQGSGRLTIAGRDNICFFYFDDVYLGQHEFASDIILSSLGLVSQGEQVKYFDNICFYGLQRDYQLIKIGM